MDIDSEEMDRLTPEIGLIDDSKVACQQLIDALSSLCKPSLANRERIAAAKQATQGEIQKIQPQIDYLKTIRDVLPRDNFFVAELCQMGFASLYGFPVYEPRTYVTAGYQGTLGFGFPVAIGVKVANPDKAVVSITGDGGFMFGVQELATCAQFNIGLITLAFNNQAFGNVRRDQQAQFDNRIIASELKILIC